MQCWKNHGTNFLKYIDTAKNAYEKFDFQIGSDENEFKAILMVLFVGIGMNCT